MMLGFIRKSWLVGLGVLALVVGRAKRNIDNLVKKGETSQKKITKRLVETGENCSERAKVVVRRKRPWWKIRIVRR